MLRSTGKMPSWRLLQADTSPETKAEDEAAEGEEAGEAPEKPAVKEYDVNNEPNRIVVTFKRSATTALSTGIPVKNLSPLCSSHKTKI